MSAKIEVSSSMRLFASLRYLVPALASIWLSPAMGQSTADVAGHYYLHGVREVGSELLLRPDGRYEWFLSYGASDMTSAGTWRLNGKQITLTADIKPKKIALKLEPVVAWSDDMDDALRHRLTDAAKIQAFARCPFLGGEDATDLVSTPFPAASSPAERAALLAQAKVDAIALTVQVVAKRALLDKAITDFLGQTKGKPGWQAASDRAMAALSDFEAARRIATGQYEAAEMDRPPVLGYFIPPAVCGLPNPDDFKVGDIPYAAVSFQDPVTGLKLKGTTASFFFADGTHTDNIAIIDGLAFVTMRAANPIEAVEVQAGKSRFEELGFDLSETRFAVHVASPLVIPISFNGDALMPRTFNTLTLTLSDGALTAEMFRHGRYERDK